MATLPPRISLRAMLCGRDLPEDRALRSPRPADLAALGELMYAAYFGTTDYHGESEQDAFSEVERTFNGAYGRFRWDVSRVYEEDGRIFSAALVTQWRDGPLLTFSMTHPERQRQGLARKCILAAMGALFSAGDRELRLAVTLANEPAVRLYQALGFSEDE